MKLSQMFSGLTQVRETLQKEETHAQQQTARNIAAVNRQIRSLVPGQTISGEIVGRNGGEVQIKLSEDMVLNARVDRNLNMEIGKNMTFEVKNNGSSLTLSPLFTNVATDVNVLKALDMAALPVNRTSVEMTEQLMAAGLPVNRNTLLQVYREINSFPQAQISDVIDLHRLQMPVNEENLNQMASYRNLTHQLLQGMESVTQALPEAFAALQDAGDAAGAVKLYQEIFMLVQEGQEAGQPLPAAPDGSGQPAAVQGELQQAIEASLHAEIQGSAAEQSAEAQNIKAQAGDGEILMLQAGLELPESGMTEEASQKAVLPQEGQAAGGAAQLSTGASEVPAALRAAVSEEVLAMVRHLPLSEQQMSEVARQAQQFAAGELDVPRFMNAMNQLAENIAAEGQENVLVLNEAQGHAGKGMQALAKMFSQPAFSQLLNSQIKNLWTIRPKEVAEPGRVEELYRRLDRQLKGLTQALESAGQTSSAAYKAVSSMAQNVDFLQQINQMYTYVQLPLHLQQGEAHGDLYVYTNKKHLAQADGRVSALLHLDMEHLGPVDVYVTLQNSKVNTNFHVRDDEMLDFLAEHMDILTERLKKRGYDCSYSMTTRGEDDSEAAAGGIAPLLQQEKGVSLAQYAFDVRT